MFRHRHLVACHRQIQTVLMHYRRTTASFIHPIRPFCPCVYPLTDEQQFILSVEPAFRHVGVQQLRPHVHQQHLPMVRQLHEVILHELHLIQLRKPLHTLSLTVHNASIPVLIPHSSQLPLDVKHLQEYRLRNPSLSALQSPKCQSIVIVSLHILVIYR